MSLEDERAAARRAIDTHGEALVNHESRIEALEHLMQQMPTIMAQAMKQGAREVVSDPGFWEAAGRAMHEQATKRAGTFVLGGLGAFARRIGWVLAIGLGVYMLGGWTALVAWLKNGGPP